MLSWFDSSLVYLYLISLFVFALYGMRRKNGSRENLILAGRRLTLPAFVATLVSTWYGGILGVGEFSYLYGLSNWLVFGVPYYTAALIFALFLAKRARRSMEITIPDRLAGNYGSAASVAGSTVLIIVTLPAAYILMIGVLLNQFFGLPVWLGIVGGAFFSVFYVMTGGFRAVLWTDILQFTLMFVGFIILFVTSVVKFGWLEYLQANLPEAHFSASGGNEVSYIALWYIIALATLVEPAFYQRCFAAKSEKVARNGIFVSIGFWIFFDFLTTMCGLYARAALPNLDNAVAAYPAYAMEILPAGLLGVFLLSLLATIMSTVDSYMFLAGTTFSHDLIWRFKKFDEKHIGKYTGLGLVISSIVTIGIALVSESVVELWKDFGSIGTPALLLPLLTTYWGKYKYSNKGALLSITLTSVITTFCIFYPKFTESGANLFGVEPIYIGLGISIIVFLASKVEKQSQLIDR